MRVELKLFSELDIHELYAILHLRSEIFVVEQNCVYLDTDYKDQDSYHLLVWGEKGYLVGYCRILPPGLAYSMESSIGRVVTKMEERRTGLGIKMMEWVIEHTLQLFPHNPIRIEAQSYLIPFYSRFGFLEEGEDYILDGIPHREMILTP
ncbi:MAG: GNAT family N-acetyltransferase [Saprospiraceae bacterium]